MPASTKRRVTRRPAERPHNRNSFAAKLRQFLTNKAIAEAATLRNEGDEKKKIPGLKKALLAEVMQHGEVDPETGSVFYDLDQPIDIPESGQRYKRVKAEKRQGDAYLDADKARAFLKKKKLLDKVEEFRYVLRLDAETAELFAEWLKETDLITKVESTDAVLVEDNLLALYHREKITEKELDSLYSKPEPSWAFKPLTS